jgi:aspartate kinase
VSDVSLVCSPKICQTRIGRTDADRRLMARIVQKFGGTSVANVERIRRAAQIAVGAAQEGNEVTTVVSAMGDTTDRLIALAHEINDVPNLRDLDMLLTTGEQQSVALMSLAIQQLGWPARSFTGGQAGVITESRHGSANIKEVNPVEIEASLNRGEIAVVAGFQGVTSKLELTTLGRGGSDTTAVALASALDAERCDIYTDVAGVFTADPRILNEAKRLPCLSYEEMLELAATGAQVMNQRSVELAMDNHVPVRIRSAFEPDDAGTLVTHRLVAPEYTICGITLDTNQVSFSLKFPHSEEECKPLDQVSALFTRLNELNIPTDMVMLLAHEDEPYQELAFTTAKNVSTRVGAIIQSIWGEAGAVTLSTDETIARLSVVGRKFTSRPEVVAAVFDTLNQASIPVHMVATGDLRMSLLLPFEYAHRAVRLIHSRFGLTEDMAAA